VVTNYPTLDSVEHTYSTVTWVVADDRYCNDQLLFTLDCTREVSDTLYHSGPDIRHYECDSGIIRFIVGN